VQAEVAREGFIDLGGLGSGVGPSPTGVVEDGSMPYVPSSKGNLEQFLAQVRMVLNAS
jgi:hypothetical protein